MSKEQREKKRKNKKRKWFLAVFVCAVVLAIVLIVQYRDNKVSLVEKSVFRDSYRTKVYFFKDVDYIELDNFNVSSLVVSEGSKVNGYMPLTHDAMTVKKDFLQFQIDTIDVILNDEIYNDWTPVINEIGGEVGIKVKGQEQINGQQENPKTDYLINAVRYIGLSTEKLQKIKEQYQALLADGSAREVTLSGFHMLSSGYLYGTIKSYEKTASEKMMPYIDSSVLKRIDGIGGSETTALKVINNDHLFAAVEIGSGIDIQNQEYITKLKQEFCGTADKVKNSDYYDLLVKRGDLLRNYPEIFLNDDIDIEKKYKAYMVDVIPGEDSNIIVLLLKDYINVFASDNIKEMEININEYDAFVVEESAVFTKDGQTCIKKMDTGLYKEDIPVTVGNTKNGKTYLPVWSNQKIETNMSYKVYP